MISTMIVTKEEHEKVGMRKHTMGRQPRRREETREAFPDGDVCPEG
jgi:hypothetical protein